MAGNEPSVATTGTSNAAAARAAKKSEAETKTISYLGFSKKDILVLVVIAMFLVIAIAASIGGVAGIRKHQGSSKSGGINNTLSPKPPVPSSLIPGLKALKHTGMVALDLADGSSTIQFYYQAENGDIRVARYDDGPGWRFSVEPVVTDARSGTAITALAYVFGGELTVDLQVFKSWLTRQWHVYYFDKNNILQEQVHSNRTGSWQKGSLGSSGFKASPSVNAGLTACRNLKWYGAPLDINNGGIRLFYGGADGNVHEIFINNGQFSWTAEHIFEGTNGDGAVECTVRGKSVTTAWLLNKENDLEMWWYEFDASKNSSAHPALVWTKGSTYSSPAYNSSLSAITSDFTGDRYVHFQTPNGTVYELINSGLAESASWSKVVSPIAQGFPNTKIACVVIRNSSRVFIQTQGNDITEFQRPVEAPGFETNAWSAGVPFTFIQNDTNPIIVFS